MDVTTIKTAEILPANPGAMTINVASDLFLRRHSAANTQTTYRRALLIFFGWCRDCEINPIDLTVEQAISFKEHLEEEFAASTAATYGQAVRAFYATCREMDMTATDGTAVKNWFATVAKVKAPKVKPVGKSLDRDSIEDILEAARKNSQRDWLIIRLMYEGGLRREEVITLHKKDLYLGEGWVLRVTGKGQKERLVGLTDDMAYALLAFFESTGASAWAFPGKAAGEHLCLRSVNHIVAGYCGPGVTPHTFRHSHVTQSLLNDVPVQDVSRTVGHASIVTTMRYYDSIHAVRQSSSRALGAKR
jgi:integrase/recombinase XerD